MAKRVNIGLDEKTHNRAKAISALKGVSLGQYFEQAIEDAVKDELKMLGALVQEPKRGGKK